MSKRNLIFPHYPNLVLKRLSQDTTVAELIETFNYNFEQLYLHKGVKGEKGEKGSRGTPGLTRKGDKGDKGDKGNHVTVTSNTVLQDGDPVNELNPDGTPKNPGDIVISANGSVYSVYVDNGVLRYKKEISLLSANKDLFKTIRTYKELGHIIQGHTIKDYNSTGITDNSVMLGVPILDPLTNEIYSNYYTVALGTDREIPGNVSTLSLVNIIREPYDRTTRLPKEETRRNKQITLWYRQHYKHNTITDTGYAELSYTKADTHMRAILGTKYAGIGMYTDINTLGSTSVLGNRNKSVMSLSADTILFTGAIAGIPSMTPTEWDYLKMTFNPAEDSVLLKYKKKMDIGSVDTELEVYGDIILHTLRCSREIHYRIEKNTGLLNVTKNTDQMYLVVDNANGEELKGISGLSHNSIVITEFVHTTVVRKNTDKAIGQAIQLNGNESITFKPGQIVIWKYADNTLKLLTGATDQELLIKMLERIVGIEDNYYGVNPDPLKKKGHPLPVASNTKAGIVKLATEVEATDSSNNTVVLTPYTLSTLIPTKTIVYNIGKWDMSKNKTVSIQHTLGSKWTKVVGIDVMIFTDELTRKIRLGDPDQIEAGHSVSINETHIIIALFTLLGEDFNSVGINRGHVEVRYYEKLEEPTVADAIIRTTQDAYNLRIPFGSPSVSHSLGYSVDSMGGQIEGIEWSVIGGDASQVTFSGNPSDNPKQIIFSKEGSYTIELKVVTKFQGKKNRTPKTITYSVSKQTDITPPTAPVLSINRTTQTEVSLIWSQSVDAESGIKEYRILRDGNKIHEGQSILEYTDRTVTPDKSYRYLIEVEDNAGNTVISNEVVAITPPTSTLTVSAGGNKTAQFKDLNFVPPRITGILLVKNKFDPTNTGVGTYTCIPILQHGSGYNRNSIGFNLVSTGGISGRFFYGEIYSVYDGTKNNPNVFDRQLDWNLLQIQEPDKVDIIISVTDLNTGEIRSEVHQVIVPANNTGAPDSMDYNFILDNTYMADFYHRYYPVKESHIKKLVPNTNGYNTVPLTGSVISVGATVTGTQWEIVSKPTGSDASITNTNSVSTQLQGISKYGDHNVKLTGSNNNNQTKSDSVIVSVTDPRGSVPDPQLIVIDKPRNVATVIENTDENFRRTEFTSANNRRIEVFHDIFKYASGQLQIGNKKNSSISPWSENVFLIPSVCGNTNRATAEAGNIQNIQWQYSINGAEWRYIIPYCSLHNTGGRYINTSYLNPFAYFGVQLLDAFESGSENSLKNPMSTKISQDSLSGAWTNCMPVCVSHLFPNTSKGNCSIKWRYRYMTWDGKISNWSNEVETLFLKQQGALFSTLSFNEQRAIGYRVNWYPNSVTGGGLISAEWDTYSTMSIQNILAGILKAPDFKNSVVPLYIKSITDPSAPEYKVSDILGNSRGWLAGIHNGFRFANGFELRLYSDASKTRVYSSAIITENSVSYGYGGGGGGSYGGGGGSHSSENIKMNDGTESTIALD